MIKWFIFRLAVTYYLHEKIGGSDCPLRWCWQYSDGFDNFFDDARWISLIDDAKYSVDEELSCWSE